jgi:hypothetical protein
MRLRSLRRLEEMELNAERDALTKERADLADLLASDRASGNGSARTWNEVRKLYGKATPLGPAAPSSPTRPKSPDIPYEAMIDREPITVICSKMGWIRAMKGHVDLAPGTEIQGWRRPPLRLPRRDDRQDPSGGRERPVLHPAGRKPARRARAWANPSG